MHLVTDEYFIDCVLAEVTRARENYPKTKAISRLFEEAGELAQAANDIDDGKGFSWKPVWDEAVQTAAMALWMATEGDHTLAVPNHINTRNM